MIQDFLNKYPYTDFHELNLDWIISVIKALDETMESFVNVNTIKYADPLLWSITTQYVKNTLVQDADGNTYLSKQAVPTGVALSNTDYWLKVADVSTGVDIYKRTIADIDEGISTTASQNISTNTLFWLNNYLYKAISDITIGNAFVEGTNCSKVTIEELLNQITTEITSVSTALAQEVTDRQTANAILQTNITSVSTALAQEVTDRQTADATLQTNIDNIGIVTVKNYGAVGDGVTDDTDAIQNAISQTTYNTIIIPPGKYHTTRSIQLRDGIRLIGYGRNTCEFIDSFPTGTFTLANNVFIENINFETDNNEDGFALYGDGVFAVNVNQCDNLGGFFNQTKSKFIKMVNSWHTLLLNDIIIDCGSVTGYAIDLQSDGDNTLNKDLQMRNVFVDTWLSTSGGCINLDSVYGAVMNNCIVRSKATCLNLVRNTGNGTCTCECEETYFDTDNAHRSIIIGSSCEFNNYNSSWNENSQISNNGTMRTFDNNIVKTIVSPNNFTLVNSSTAFTDAQVDGSFNFIKHAVTSVPSGVNLSLLTQALPSSATWNVSCMMEITCILKQFSKCGVCLYDTTSGNIWVFGLFCNSDGISTLGLIKYNSVTEYSSDVRTANFNLTNKLWLSIVNDGTNYKFYYSINGKAWLDFATIAVADITTNNIGLAIDSETVAGESYPVIANISQWRVG